MAELKAEMVLLTKKELDDLVYFASYRAANRAMQELYKGLAERFLYENEGTMKTILFEIEEMNRR